ETERDYINWNTNTRTTAIVLGALIAANPESDLIPGVVRWLMVARTADDWETTQETAWAVMSLTDWMLATNELNGAYAWDVSLNETAIDSGEVTPQTITETTQLLIE